MEPPRDVAQRFTDLPCAQDFAGTRTASTPMTGRWIVKDTLVGAIGSFQKPLQQTFQRLIVEGRRAVGLASGEDDAGPTGLPCAQPHDAVGRSIENGESHVVVEFMDSVAVDVALFDQNLVPA